MVCAGGGVWGYNEMCASREVGLEGNREKTDCVFMSSK